MKKAPREPAGGRRLGGLPLMYLSGRMPDSARRCSRRETRDSNPGPPRLKDAAGLEPALRTISDAFHEYKAGTGRDGDV